MSAILVKLKHWKCICERCDYGKKRDWISKDENKPKSCPNCKSTYWETKAKEGNYVKKKKEQK